MDLLDRVLDNQKAQYLHAGDVSLHRSRRLVEGPTGRHRLTQKLTDLLALLISHPNYTLSRSTLMAEVWNVRSTPDTHSLDTRTLDVHIHWLREIIEPDPSDPALIVTVRGEGYCFTPVKPDA